MRMILLLLGWHLTVIGILAIILGIAYSLIPVLIFGIGSIVIGLFLSYLLRKTCASYWSDPSEKAKAGKGNRGGFV